MKYGFMPQFGEDLYSEITFAKQNFDFFEFTPENSLFEVSKLKKALGKFKILGHLNWNIDFSQQNTNLSEISPLLNKLQKLKIKKLTVHPSINNSLNLTELRKNNIKNLSLISDFCNKNKIIFCIENISGVPFNDVREIEYLIKNIPNTFITLDVGHTLKISEKEFNNFLKLENKIKHVHLHNIIKNKDHLFFYNKKAIIKRINKLKDLPELDTITLEMFRTIKKGEFQYKITQKERHRLLLKQLNWIDLFKNNHLEL